jgi:hypothetical protein
MSMRTDGRYPARLAIDFPDRGLDRMATFLRLIYATRLLAGVSLNERTQI